MKDGTFVGFLCDSHEGDFEVSTFYPDEQIPMGDQGIYVDTNANNVQFRIVFDVNGEEEPNLTGKDIFKVVLSEDGILYDPK